MNRELGAVGIASALSILALWLVPPVGFVAVLVLLIILPPWGRSLSERAILSALVVMGIVAVAFPRAGGTPVTSTSTRILLAAIVIVFLALRILPSLRKVVIPKPTLSDGLVLALAALSSFWLMSAYLGKNAYEMVSGLFFSGWDNQGHFTTFANTYEVGSTTWPTLDGSIAWNQWYPSLHTTLWSLAELGTQRGSDLVDRTALVFPFIQWSAISFGLCLAALAWVAGDLAARLGSRDRSRFSRPVAIGLVSIFGLLGSPALLFNMGFTNFVMGVAVAVVVGYISARSWRSARMLGWFLIPLGALTIIGLWTPLVLGLVPSGIVVAIALIRYRLAVGIAWLVGTAAMAAVLALTQSAAILGAEPGQSTADFTTSLGSVGTGMAAFNVGAAIAAPIVVIVLVVLLARARRWPLPVAIAGPTLGAGVLVIVFALSADAAGVGRLQSYYVLKCLDAMLLSAAPLIGAVLAVAVARALTGVSRLNTGLALVAGGVLVVGIFGYVGVVPTAVQPGFTAAAGIQAGADRTRGVNDPLVGEAIVRGAAAATPYPEYVSLLWDGSGTLPNLWVSSLTGVMSKKDNFFYRGLPSFPYEEKSLQYLDLAMNVDPSLRVAVLWFREPSGVLLQQYVQDRGDDRVKLVQVPMPSNALCPECSL